MLAPSKHADAVAVEDAGMRELPDGWALATISDLIGRGGIFIDGDWVESKDQDPSGDVRLIQLADVGDGVYLDKSSRFLTAKKSRELKCTYLVPGDVLIARMPDPLGRACIYPGDPKRSVTAVDVCVVRMGVNGPNHHWLAWFVNSPEFRGNVASLQSGSTRKRISRKNLSTIALPVPPLPEQHRIVAEIEKQFTRLDASVAALKRVQANLKRYRASVLKAACEGRLVPTEAELARAEGRDYEPADQLLERILAERRARWESQENRRGTYKDPIVLDTSALPCLPEGWVWSRFDQLVSTLEGGTAVSASNTRSNRPVLRSSAVRQGLIDYDDYRYLPDGAKQGPDPYVAKGDLLFTRLSGTLEYVGNCAVVGELRGRKIEFPDRIFRGRCVSCISPNFIQLAFAEKTLRRSLEAKAKSSAGHQRISLSDLREYCVPLPPLAEQHRIVAEVERRLSVIQQTEAMVEANLTGAERLRQSILKQAFSGKLVRQDPNDEPASELLERLRAEREAAQASAKPRSRAKRRRARSSPEGQLVLGVQEKTS